MKYLLLVALAFLFLAIIWNALGFGRDNHCLIKNDKVVAGGLVILLGCCTFCWTICIGYGFLLLGSKLSSLISYLL